MLSVFEPGGGAGVSDPCLKIRDGVSKSEGAAVGIVGAIASNAKATVTDRLLLNPDLTTAGEAPLYPDGLAALAGEIPKRLQIHHIRIDRGGRYAPLVLRNEAYYPTAIIYGVISYPAVGPFRFTASPFKADGTSAAAIAAGASIEAGDILTAAALTADDCRA